VRLRNSVKEMSVLWIPSVWLTAIWQVIMQAWMRLPHWSQLLHWFPEPCSWQQEI
jgi:MsbA_lipidA: lipid A export permease/ATP-binding protein MsbA